MNTGKYQSILINGSFSKKFIAKVKVLNSWLKDSNLKQVSLYSGRPTIVEYLDFLYSIVMYGTTLEDYVLFKFYNKGHKGRKTYATGKKIHKFFDQVNKKEKTYIFTDKSVFPEYFSSFMGREIFIIDEKSNNIQEAKAWLQDKKVIFAKTCHGTQGKGVTRLEVKDADEVVEFCLNNKYFVMENEIKQHPAMARLYPKAVNTIRFITLVDGNEVKILGARLRMGLTGYLDNLGSGGITASVDVNSGVIDTPAYSKNGDVFKVHPVTNITLLGYKIPFWREVVELCKKAAMVVPEVRCVGWDVAITPNKPIIIEGNDRWCRFVWQLPVQKGLYSLIQ